jgi:hypothetical protein
MGVKRWHGVSLMCLAAAACAHGSIERRAQPDGSYRVDCKGSLTRCLTAVEEVCRQGYEVIEAREDVRYLGPIEPNEPIVTSEVVARCKGAALRPSAAEKLVPAPPTRCVPGATQACVGAGACRGGQSCLADGSAFGPCDCGASTRDAVPAPVQSPDGGA